jgi:hypothetical protein
MIRRATFLLSSIASICLAMANPAHAKPPGVSAIQDLQNIRKLLSEEAIIYSTPNTSSPPSAYWIPSITVTFLPAYFDEVGNAFQSVGYPEIASILKHSGAQTLDTLVQRKVGRPLTQAKLFSRRLANAVARAKSTLGEAPPYRGPFDMIQPISGTNEYSYTTSDYLRLAKVFADDLSRAIRNIKANRPTALGIPTRAPVTLTVITNDYGNVLSVIPNW